MTGYKTQNTKPDPYHVIMECLESIGESVEIRYGQLKSKDVVPHWYFVSHKLCDGIGGFMHLLRELNNDNISQMPASGLKNFEVLDVPKNSGGSEDSASVEWERLENFKELSSDVPHISWTTFSVEETTKIIKRSKRANVSVNSFLLWNIHQLIYPLFNDQKKPFVWQIPINLRGSIDSDGSDTSNQWTGVKLPLRPTDSALNIKKKFEDILRSSIAINNYRATCAIAQKSKNEIEIILRKQNETDKRVGCFSNLGVWATKQKNKASSIESQVWLFSPPLISRIPLSVGCITVNGKMSLTLQFKPKLCLNFSNPESWLERLRGIILNDNLDVSKPLIKGVSNG